jgi:hypothetical protein
MIYYASVPVMLNYWLSCVFLLGVGDTGNARESTNIKERNRQHARERYAPINLYYLKRRKVFRILPVPVQFIKHCSTEQTDPTAEWAKSNQNIPYQHTCKPNQNIPFQSKCFTSDPKTTLLLITDNYRSKNSAYNNTDNYIFSNPKIMLLIMRPFYTSTFNMLL